MDNLMESLSPRLLLISLFLAAFVLFTVFYIIRRRHGIFVLANCRFCNNWIKVLYENRNNEFECPTCWRYNGFNEDGDKFKNSTNEAESFSNGLCSYCNNNQQLKIQQLANFIPLDNQNYDVEIEDFQKLLEKRYELCKRCDKVLKTKIDMQNASVFGNKINSRNSVLTKVIKKIKHSLGLRFTTYMLMIFSLILVSLTVEIDIYHMHIIQKYIPAVINLDLILPDPSLFYDFYHLVRNAMANIIDNGIQCYELFPNNGKMEINSLVPVSIAGFLLEMMLLIWDNLILVTTSLNPFHKCHYIYIWQVVCALVMFSLIAVAKLNLKRSPVKKKCVFKKLRSKVELRNSYELDQYSSDDDYSNEQIPPRKLNFSRSVAGNEAGGYHSDQPLFRNIWSPNYSENSKNSNDSFATARSTKTTYVGDSSLNNDSCSSCELSRSLENLHISNLRLEPTTYLTNIKNMLLNSVNRPLFSPPLFKNATHLSWTAGGFWNKCSTIFPSASDFTNHGHSSSQSSGFVSNNKPVISNTFGSRVPPRETSICCDFARRSILPEPAYHFKTINYNNFNTSKTKNNFRPNASIIKRARLTLSPKSNQLYCKDETNKPYPYDTLNHNDLLRIQGDSHNNALNSLSSNGFNSTNRFIGPILFSERPIKRSLFKHIPRLNSTQYQLSTSNCQSL